MSTTGGGEGGGGIGGGARAGCCHSIRIPALATLESCCQPKWVAASRTSCNGSCSYLNVLKSLARLNRQPAEWQNSSPVGCQDAGHPSSQPSVRYAHCSCHGTVPPSLWFLFLAFCMSSLLLYFLFAKDEVHRGLCGYTGGIANQLAIASLRCQCYSMVLCSF